MKSMKLNLLMSGVLLLVCAALLVVTTFAYFSDTKRVTNTLTVGNVAISLSEAAVKHENGNLVEDTSKPRIFGDEQGTVNDYGKVYPAMTIHKDPTVINTGSEDAWLAMRLTVSATGNLAAVMGYGDVPGIDIRMLLSGALFDETVHVGKWNGFEGVNYTSRYAMLQKADPAQGTYTFYVFFKDVFSPGEKITLFNTLGFPPEWSGADMRHLVGFKMYVEAFAVQTFELEDCYTAMTEAFPTHFDFTNQ